MSPSPPRHPGAQPNNKNAFKHGLYAQPRPFRPDHSRPPEPPPLAPDLLSAGQDLFGLPQSPGLQSEIAAIRAHMLRLDAILRAEPQPEKFALYFRILCDGYNTLSRMLRIQRFLVPEDGSGLQQKLLEIANSLTADLERLDAPPALVKFHPPHTPE